MNGKQWTAADKAYLKRNYRGTNAAKLATHLGRTEQQVKQKASDMKISKKRREWSKED